MTLKIEEIEAISNGDHGDLFAVLGLHTVNVEGKEKLVFRTFRPDAKELNLHIKGVKKPVSVPKISDAGLFEHVFSRRKKRFDYTIHVKPYEGEEYEIEGCLPVWYTDL